MARKPTIDPSVKIRARQLRRGGRSRDQVRRDLAAEGHEVSAGWLSAAFREEGPGDDAPQPTPRPPTPEAIEAAVVAVEDPKATLDDVRAALGALVPMLRTMIERDGGGEDCPKCGRGETNIDGVSKLTRALIAAGSLVVKTAPDTVADPNEHPDMIAVARRTREKLAEMFSKAVAP